ncbi:MAG: PD-(D/E)XK nuclease family protein, partial [Beijerinckiaceae bacterium]
AADPPPLRDMAVRRAAARQRGDLIHLLFQHLPDLPPERRASAGAALAQARYGGLDADVRAEALEGALRLLGDARWASLFSQEARAEVDIAGKVEVGGRLVDVAGRIDRLLISPDAVTILDYKTGQPPSDLGSVARSHLRQLAVYRALVMDLYPERHVRTAILWTAAPEIVVLEPEALKSALRELTLEQPHPGKLAP